MRIRWISFIAAAIVGSACAVGNQSRDRQLVRKLYNELVDKFGRDFEHKPPIGPFGLGWTNRAITQSGPLAKARRALDLSYEHTKNKLSLVQAARGSYLKNPEDEGALYAWGYVATRFGDDEFQRGSYYWDEFESRFDWAVLRGQFATIRTGSEFDLVRLRFLIDTNRTDRTDLIPFGRKLLNLDPKDRRVKLALAAQLAKSRVPGFSDEALDMADALLATDQTRLQYWAIKPTVFFYRSMYSNTPSDLTSAIKWYRLYYAKAPAGSVVSSRAKSTIDMLERKLANTSSGS